MFIGLQVGKLRIYDQQINKLNMIEEIKNEEEVAEEAEEEKDEEETEGATEEKDEDDE